MNNINNLFVFFCLSNTCAYPHKEDSMAHTSSEDQGADDHDGSESSVEDDTESSVEDDTESSVEDDTEPSVEDDTEPRAEPYWAARGALSSVEDDMLEPRVDDSLLPSVPLRGTKKVVRQEPSWEAV